MKKTNIALAILLAASLSACGDDRNALSQQQQAQQAVQAQQAQAQYQQPAQAQPQVVQAAPAPVIVQAAPAAPAHDSGNMIRDMMLGGMIGHMIGSNSGGGGNSAPARQTTVVNKTIVNKTIVQEAPKPAVAPAPAPVVNKPVAAPKPPMQISQGYRPAAAPVSAPRPTPSYSYRPSTTSSFRR